MRVQIELIIIAYKQIKIIPIAGAIQVKFFLMKQKT